MKKYFYFAISGFVSLLAIAYILNLIPIEGFGLDETIILTTVEISLLSVFLLSTSRLVNGSFFYEKGLVKEGIVFGSVYSLSETYFKVKGVNDLNFINTLLQRTLFSYWGQVPIPSTLIMTVSVCALLGFSSRNSFLFFFTGLPLSLLILVYFNYWIF